MIEQESSVTNGDSFSGDEWTSQKSNLHFSQDISDESIVCFLHDSSEMI